METVAPLVGDRNTILLTSAYVMSHRGTGPTFKPSAPVLSAQSPVHPPTTTSTDKIPSKLARHSTTKHPQTHHLMEFNQHGTETVGNVPARFYSRHLSPRHSATKANNGGNAIYHRGEINDFEKNTFEVFK